MYRKFETKHKPNEHYKQIYCISRSWIGSDQSVYTLNLILGQAIFEIEWHGNNRMAGIFKGMTLKEIESTQTSWSKIFGQLFLNAVIIHLWWDHRRYIFVFQWSCFDILLTCASTISHKHIKLKTISFRCPAICFAHVALCDCSRGDFRQDNDPTIVKSMWG